MQNRELYETIRMLGRKQLDQHWIKLSKEWNDWRNTCYLTELQEQLSKRNGNQEAKEITEDGALRQSYVFLSPDNKVPTALYAFLSQLKTQNSKKQRLLWQKSGTVWLTAPVKPLRMWRGKEEDREIEIKRSILHDLITDWLEMVNRLKKKIGNNKRWFF